MRLHRVSSYVLFWTTLLMTSATTGAFPFSCPQGEFECVGSQTCIAASWKCDGDDDCIDGEDEKDCGDDTRTCRSGYFRCNNGQCIEPSWICDGHADCSGGEDEAPNQKCNRTTCSSGDFQCRNGDCIQGDFKCDYELDCQDGSDETGCAVLVCTTGQFMCAHNRTCISKELLCNRQNDCTDASDETGCPSCPSTKFQCRNKECIPQGWRCDGDHDCQDHSDEDSCSATATAQPCRSDKFQCGNGNCIPERWKCDGEDDCMDKSDEQGCPANITCSTSQFTCTSGKCIPGNFKCNGARDCPDGSDEAGCASTPAPCSPSTFRCGESSFCVEMSKVCNNAKDCPNGEDESPYCNINECSDHNGHCSQHCTDQIIGYQCSCNPGFKLTNDSRSCEDNNECEEQYGICSQTCLNTKGSYKCSCVDGYVMEATLNTCKVKSPSPYLIFGDQHSVRNLTMAGTQYNVLASNRKAPMAVDYHIESGHVYWTDILDEKIERTRYGGSGKVETVVDNVRHSNGLAVDWVAGNLYWTDESSKSIEVSQLNGANRLRLFTVHGGDPRGIAVDPFKRLLFWTDWGSIRPKLERASMDGNSVSRIVIIDTDIIWPTSLALDTILQRVYFADSKLQRVESCNYDGLSRRLVIPSGLLHPLSLSVFEDYLYYTDYSLGKIFSVNKFTGQQSRAVISNLERPTGVAVVHPVRHKTVESKCREKNGGCSHLCLLSTNVKKFSCRCPEGMHLHSDGRTCKRMVVVNDTVTSQPRLVTGNPTEKITTCVENRGGCSHICSDDTSTGVFCRCPKGMKLLEDRKSCQVIVKPSSAVNNGTGTPVLQRHANSRPNQGPLIAGVTVAVIFVIFLLVAIVLYCRKRSRDFRDRTILFYKDNSRVPLQDDFDDDPSKTPDEIASRSRVQFA